MYPICSVEPATASDVAIIMKILREKRVPFAVKGGGHSFNPGFSSTRGVHIYMRRFSKTTFYPNNQTVDIGPGLIWDDVYKALEPYNVSVIGGRITGVGVGGFTLGGGYGWKSNQYGLAIDNVFEYQLVTPNGTIVYVNNQSYHDIFFGLKGGFNNFGIVTNFNVRALPQTLIYGGILIYFQPDFDSVLAAVVNFQNNNADPKAQILCNFLALIGVPTLNIVIFYDAPTAPESLFQEFLNITSFPLLPVQTRSQLSLVQGLPTAVGANMR
ncbi:unnamed protein product [Rotaria sordida]|uniref:FAD-binding PCMH-type domain-containing protein n=1 Tax=Rotaria sordida TaxID=392033 RepID=A0A815L7I6_9BILA|nr:unnamed protein product [Rotaria sordida]CAF1405369.1 unnamed protein product [Rotaria sordida]CAF3796244.1 unnamed protein product [Rotaria sordida]CAF4095154.1 unnamed protein product [Rotaria sordida]